LSQYLHIISLTVPYPVDYGGVFDLFYKLPALQQQGVHIHLHCFDYGRGPQPELEKYCASVHYYQRQPQALGGLPYIVASRKNETLLNTLLQDDHPILMEGIHCTYLLNDARFARRKCLVRLHNVEFEYYHDLYKASRHPFKKLYYFTESRRLKRYEQSIANKAIFLSVTEKDARTYREIFGCRHITHLPLFLPPWKVDAITGVGTYCLYQGDLSVEANHKMARWLVKKVFRELKIQLIIAGKQPSANLQQLVQQHNNIQLIADPTEAAMQQLISEAHINIIPSHSATGIKLKLLNALYNGRHCLVNEATVAGTGFEQLCHIAHTAAHTRDMVEQLYHQPFREEEIMTRKAILHTAFNNTMNALKLLEILMGSNI